LSSRHYTSSWWVLLDWVGRYVSWETSIVCCWELCLTICYRLTSYNVILQHNYYQRFLSDQQSEFIIFPSLT
jgi:fumarate reductase subunit C